MIKVYTCLHLQLGRLIRMWHLQFLDLPFQPMYSLWMSLSWAVSRLPMHTFPLLFFRRWKKIFVFFGKWYTNSRTLLIPISKASESVTKVDYQSNWLGISDSWDISMKSSVSLRPSLSITMANLCQFFFSCKKSQSLEHTLVDMAWSCLRHLMFPCSFHVHETELTINANIYGESKASNESYLYLHRFL